MMYPRLPGWDLGVVVVIDLHVDELLKLLEIPQRLGDLMRVGRVEVMDAPLQQAETYPLAVVVEDRDLAPVLRLPRHRPHVRHLVRILVDLVLPPCNPGRIDRVRDRVLQTLIVEGVLEVAPRLADVRG